MHFKFHETLEKSNPRFNFQGFRGFRKISIPDLLQKQNLPSPARVREDPAHFKLYEILEILEKLNPGI